MTGPMIVGVVAVATAIGLTLMAVARVPNDLPAGPGRLLVQSREVAVYASDRFGLVATAFVTALAGVGLIVVTMWPLGWPIKLLEPHLDRPIFAWFQRDAGAEPQWWAKLWLQLTNIGAIDLTQVWTAVAAAVLALGWASLGAQRRRWWVPLVVFPVAYLLEKTLQDLLKLVVDRGHPPTTLGSYPSGGCARVIVVYGLTAYFLLRWFATRSTRAWTAAAGLISVLATVQAYARTVNLEHWLTDVLAGLMFGTLLLAIAVAASEVLLMQQAPDKRCLGERP